MSMPVIVTSNIDRCDAVTDIIQSVALEQAALSHILNAEGEKIQKVIGMDDATAEEMLDVNKSVRSMVESISRLEMIFQSKLGLFEDCLCVCHKCVPFEDSKIETESEIAVVTKKSPTSYIIDMSGKIIPQKFLITTTPDVPLIALTLPKDATFVGNVLTINRNGGEVVLLADNGKCSTKIFIKVNVL